MGVNRQYLLYSHQSIVNNITSGEIRNWQLAIGADRFSSLKNETKDMPVNGIMAFCTFYDRLDKLRPLEKDAFDYGYKGTSGLTKLHFRLKDSIAERSECTLPRQFTLTLYPNSAFFMPLSTNRLYTHEIRSSMLDAELLPTRLGYVVRCSNTEAVHKHGDTFLKRDGELVKLGSPTIASVPPPNTALPHNASNRYTIG